MAKAARKLKTGKGKAGGAKRAKAKTPKKTAGKKSTARKSTAKKSTAKKVAAKKMGKSKAKGTATSPKKKANAAKKQVATKLAAQKKATPAAKVKAKANPETSPKTRPTIKKPPAIAAKTATKQAAPKAGGPLSATSQDPIQFPELNRRIPKTHLKAKELREYRTLLRRKRAELAGDVQHLSTEVSNRSRDGSGGDHSAMPIHMADLGTDNWEKEFTMGLIANERDRIRDIDEALERIDAKTYGICLATHRPISAARLHAKPWAKYCIDFARAREEGRT